MSFCGQSILISLTCSIRSMIPLSSSMVSSTEQGLKTTLTTFLQSTFILVSHFSSRSMVLDTPSKAIFGILLKIWKKLSFSAFMFSRRMFSISSMYTTTGFFGFQLSSFFSSQKLDFGQQPNNCSATASWICHRLFVVFPLNFIISYFPYENSVVRVNVFPAPGAPVTSSSLSLFDPEFFYWKNSSNTLLIFVISQSLQRMCFENMLPLRSARASV